MSVTSLKSEEEFAQAIANGPAVVDFTATWCGPCKMIAPKYAELAKKYTDIKFYKVDIDEASDVAGQQDISSVPTFRFFKSGTSVGTVSGADLAGITSKLRSLTSLDLPEEKSPVTVLRTPAEYDAFIKSGNAVIDFFATWCGPCKMVAPKIDQLAEHFTDVKFGKVDVDQAAELSEREGITAMPTFKLYSQGQVKKVIQGADLKAIVGFVTSHSTKSIDDLGKPSAGPGGAKNASVTAVMEKDKFASIVKDNKKVVVFFTASWSAPCTPMMETFKSLCQTYPSIKFVSVDVDDGEEIAGAEGVDAMPSFRTYTDGKKSELVSILKADELKDYLKTFASA